MVNPKLFGIVLTLGLIVTTLYSQNIMGSEQDHSEVVDLDIGEAEASNATMAGAASQTTTNGNTTEFLSIQTAQSGSISQINDTAYLLELDNVSDSTILFSDRPERIVETVSTSDFVGNWTTGPNSFSEDEPNDALIVKNAQTGDLETAVIESFTPVYDIATNSLTYTITAENAISIGLPEEFGQSILVADNKNSLPPSPA